MRVRSLLPVMSLALLPASALAVNVEGRWVTPAGLVEVQKVQSGYKGILAEPAKNCPELSPGMEVLHGELLDDTFSGELRLCLEGTACTVKESYLSALLVVDANSERMSGAVERGVEACHARLPGKGGVALHKASARGAAPRPAPKPAPPADPQKVARAQEIMRDAAQYMVEGSFEKARQRFEEALAIVPLPEIYNGIGVTYVARRQLKEALVAYKQAVELDPNFGDSYYNMACLYAGDGKPDLALKYLGLSVKNGYAQLEAMEEDHDLDGLRQDPRFQKIMKDANRGAKK